MKTISANNICISCDEFGDETAETMLLISGLGAQRIRWPNAFCESLAARGFRVIRFDNRDAGESTHFTSTGSVDFASLASAIATGQPPKVPYSLQDMVEDVIGLLDALAIQRAHLVGRSMGGMIAQLLASQYPQRVLSLAAIMSSTGNPQLPQTAPDIMAMLTTPAPSPLDDQVGFLRHSILFSKRIASTGFVFDETAQREILLEEARRAYDPAGFGRQIAAIAVTGDIRPQLAQINAPTLVIHGTNDEIIPPACGEDIAANIRGAELMLIAGMGHDFPAALQQIFIDAIVKNARR